MQQLLTFLQRLAIQNKNLVTTGLLVYEVSTLMLWAVAAWAFFTDHDSLLFWYEAGEVSGILTLGWYVLTLIPGMLKRFQLLPQISSSLMLFRRHFGISMFLTGFLHFNVVSLLPLLAFGGEPSTAPRNLAGLTGWLLLFPLWVTSNDYSVKKLGKLWHTIHNLTYLALLFIFLHVAVVLSKWGLVMGGVLVLEIISGMVAWRRRSASPTARPVVTQPTPPVSGQI